MVGITLVHRKATSGNSLTPEGHTVGDARLLVPEENLQEVPQRVFRLDRRPHLSTCERGSSPSKHREQRVRRADPGLPPRRNLPGTTRRPAPNRRALRRRLAIRLSQEVIPGLASSLSCARSNTTNIRTYQMNEGHSACSSSATRRPAHRRANPTTSVTTTSRPYAPVRLHDPHAVPPGTKSSRHRSSKGSARSVCVCSTSRRRRRRYVRPDGVRHVLRARGRTAFSSATRDHSRYVPRLQDRAITNGVHAGMWLADPISQLLDGTATAAARQPLPPLRRRPSLAEMRAATSKRKKAPPGRDRESARRYT